MACKFAELDLPQTLIFLSSNGRRRLHMAMRLPKMPSCQCDFDRCCECSCNNRFLFAVNHAFHLTARLPSVEIVTKQPSLPASKPAAFASPLTPLSSSLHPSRFGQVSSQALVVVTTAAIVKLFSRAPSHPTPIFIAPLQSATVLHRRPARPHDPTFLCHTLQPSNDNLIKMAAVVDKVAGATAEIVSEVAAAISNITVNDPKEGAAADGSRLYIGNLAYATTEEQLKEVFSSYSVVSLVCVIHGMIDTRGQT
jgi:hypothetical protein